MHTPNAQAKILQVLSEAEGSLKKTDIANKIDSTPNYVGNQMAILTRNNLVREAKGYYWITPKGKDLLHEDPFFTTLTTVRTNQNPNQNSKEITIPLTHFQNKRAFDIIHAFEDNPNMTAVLQNRINQLVPFVTLFLIAINQVPRITQPTTFEPDWSSAFYNKILNLLLEGEENNQEK